MILEHSNSALRDVEGHVILEPVRGELVTHFLVEGLGIVIEVGESWSRVAWSDGCRNYSKYARVSI